MRANKQYTIAEIADIISGNIIGDNTKTIDKISIDSRSLVLASKCLFFAINGHNNNAHDYIKPLYQRGFRCFVVERSFIDFSSCVKASFIFVDNSISALQALAKHKRSLFDYDVLAITGSNGKTIVKEYLFQILSPCMKVSRSPKSYNSQVGVPLSLWAIDSSSELAIIEAGISRNGEMEKHSNMIMPNEGIFTFLGNAHSENFVSLKEKLLEKLLLFKYTDTIYYCSDNIMLDSNMKTIYGDNKNLISWSRTKKTQLQILQEQIIDDKCIVKAIYKRQEKNISIPFTDSASIDNVIHAWLYCLEKNINDEYLYKQIDKLSAVAMRMEIKDAVANCILINDYYNSDLDSLPIALDLLNQQAGNKKRCLVLSDFLQHSLSYSDLYSKVAKLLNEKKIDKLIGIGTHISKYAYLFDENSVFYPSTEDFIAELSYNKFYNEAILLRGARRFHLEKISNILQTKTHRTTLEVDLTALVYNLNYYRSLINEDTKICVMVKAFSYGCGSVQLAKVLQYHRVDYLAVAIADEGIELRKAGINIPIIVMNPEEYSFFSMIEYSLEPEIYSFDILRSFTKVLRDSGLKNYPIHLKLDTGMLRMGFQKNDIDTLITEVKNIDSIRISSVFSHLAYADSPLGEEFTNQQLNLFEKLKNTIQSSFDYKILAHILNTAGIEHFTNKQYDMVRLGIGLYGVSSSKQEKLKNVVNLRTNISQIKTIHEESCVGYACTEVLAKGSKIAVIPIGYADGFSRKLSNGLGVIIVNGKQAPVVGSVCMDMSMINVTGLDVSVGDSVLIFGDEYPVTKMSNLLDTIPYEILTGISARVKRLYLYE